MAAAGRSVRNSAPTMMTQRSAVIITPDQQALNEFIQSREQENHNASQTTEPRTLSAEQAPTYDTPNVYPAAPSSGSQLSPVEYGDTEVIRLFP